jgi:predicted O-methyltransferase YrrM
MDKSISIRRMLAVVNLLIKEDPKALHSLLCTKVKVNEGLTRITSLPLNNKGKDETNGMSVLTALLRGTEPIHLVASYEKDRLKGLKVKADDKESTSPNPTWYDAFGDQLGYKLINIDARLTDSEKRWMWEMAKTLPEDAIYVEVGTDRGGSAHIMALANPTVRIFSIDPKNAEPKRARFLKKRYGELWDRINLVPQLSVDKDEKAFEHIRGKLEGQENVQRDCEDFPLFDVVFLDGAHTDEDITQEIDFYLPFIKPGGLLCGHDFHRNFGCRKRYSQAVIKSVADHKLRLWIFDRIWYASVPL